MLMENMQLYHVRCGEGLVSYSGTPNDIVIQAVQFGGAPPDAWLPFLQGEHGNDTMQQFIPLLHDD